MKAISKRKHQALIAALQRLEKLQQSGLPAIDIPLPSLTGGGQAAGFLQHIQSLSERFSHYK